MESETFSFPGNHLNASKEKKRKRKLGLLLNGSSETLHAHKKKKLKNGIQSKRSKQKSSKFLSYKKTKDYVKVIAKPEFLPPPPQIFHTDPLQKNKTDVSDSFLMKFLSERSFNTNISERFRQVSDDYNKKEEKEERNEVENGNKREVREAVKEKGKEKEKELVAKETVEHEEVRHQQEGEEKVESNVDFYEVAGKKALMLHLSHPSRLSFHKAEMKATIIAGEVEILGYTLSNSTGKTSAVMSSPNLYTPLIIETKVSNRQQETTEDVQLKLQQLLTAEDCNKVLNKLKPNDSLLLVEHVISTLGILLNKYFERIIFPSIPEDVSSEGDELMNLQTCFSSKLLSDRTYFKKNGQWDKIPLGQCTVICGGKGVGKSTLLRYYINKLLAVGEKVLVLDLDPGQPEFTLPGCISAVIVDEPVIGPSFTHIRDPVIITCYGDVNVSNNPSKYLECVNCVIKTCKQMQELHKMKWLVNTMGFSKGLGIDLMISILKLINPNTVVQIKSLEMWINFPFFLTPGNINSRPGFRSIPLEEVNLNHDLRVVTSVADFDKRQTQGDLTRKQLRNIMSIAYFSKAVSPPFYTLNAVQPYLISFSKVHLGIEYLLGPNEVLKAFNGNTVSLSQFEPDDEEIFSVASTGKEYFQVVVKPRVGPILGVGFIRGIDCEKKKFYLVTHLEKEVLSKVNCLTLRRISCHSMFTKQKSVKSQTVYTTIGTENVVKSAKRIFRIRV